MDYFNKTTKFHTLFIMILLKMKITLNCKYIHILNLQIYHHLEYL